MVVEPLSFCSLVSRVIEYSEAVNSNTVKAVIRYNAYYGEAMQAYTPIWAHRPGKDTISMGV